MYKNITLLGFNLRTEDYLIKIIKDNFNSINIFCIEDFNIDKDHESISIKSKKNNHPLIERGANSPKLKKIETKSNIDNLSIINLPASFSENYSKLIEFDFPKIFNFEDHTIFESYFYDNKDFSNQIITIPISEKDLITKIFVCFYQSSNKQENNQTEQIINQGILQIDTEKYLVTLEGEKIDLTFKELELLKVLASNPGRVFSRENLLKIIWDYDYYGGTRTVDVHVRRLRRKIQDHKYNFIETIWNVGYKFNEIEIG